MTAADPAAPLLAPVLITFGMAGIATGVVLCGFGLTRMGRAIRYVPYPVVGGFLGATGCLILLGAIRVITRQRLQLANLDRFANMMTSYELVAACAMALVLSDLAPLTHAVRASGHSDRRHHRPMSRSIWSAFPRRTHRRWVGPSSRRRRSR